MISPLVGKNILHLHSHSNPNQHDSECVDSSWSYGKIAGNAICTFYPHVDAFREITCTLDNVFRKRNPASLRWIPFRPQRHSAVPKLLGRLVDIKLIGRTDAESCIDR